MNVYEKFMSWLAPSLPTHGIRSPMDMPDEVPSIRNGDPSLVVSGI